MANQSEEALIKRCKHGDIEAYEELISQYEKKVYNITFRIIGDYSEAEDISQDVFVKVFKSIGSFKEKSSFYTWLYRITVNECMNTIKRRKKAAAYSIDSPLETDKDEIKREIEDKSESVEEKVERKEVRKYINEAMNLLSCEHKTMIILRDIEGLSYDEIAQILKCPTGTVKSRINRARNEMKEFLIKKKELILNYKV